MKNRKKREILALVHHSFLAYLGMSNENIRFIRWMEVNDSKTCLHTRLNFPSFSIFFFAFLSIFLFTWPSENKHLPCHRIVRRFFFLCQWMRTYVRQRKSFRSAPNEINKIEYETNMKNENQAKCETDKNDEDKRNRETSSEYLCWQQNSPERVSTYTQMTIWYDSFIIERTFSEQWKTVKMNFLSLKVDVLPNGREHKSSFLFWFQWLQRSPVRITRFIFDRFPLYLSLASDKTNENSNISKWK